jgi:MarR-like DNA-binding transcriptional regulator SgrR of sgrS sRNA
MSKEPFPLLLQVLGKPNAPRPVMMPERLARTPGDQRITTPVGSGPFRFRPDLWQAGHAMVLECNSDYLPRRTCIQVIEVWDRAPDQAIEMWGRVPDAAPSRALWTRDILRGRLCTGRPLCHALPVEVADTPLLQHAP